MKKSASALPIGIDKHGHLRRPIAAGLVAWFPGGAVAYTQITLDERNTTRMAKSPKFTANMQHASGTRFGQGLIGCAIILPLSYQLHSSTCV
jgi:hypothetical protein